MTLVHEVLNHLRGNGSVTLTSGAFDSPIPGSAFGALANSGLEAFVRAAAVEMPRGVRVNVVSPGWVSETLVALGMSDLVGTPVRTVALRYVASVEGAMSGSVL